MPSAPGLGMADTLVEGIGIAGTPNGGVLSIQGVTGGTTLGAVDVTDRAARLVGIVDTELPAPSLMGDLTANPTITNLGTFPRLLNGATWDLARSIQGQADATAGVGITATGLWIFNGVTWDRWRGVVDTELPAAAALSDTFANPTAPAVGAMDMYWDPIAGIWARNPITLPTFDGTAFASAGRIVTVTQADQTNIGYRGIQIFIDITAIGASTLQVFLHGKDPTSGKYVQYVASAALAAVATTVLRIYPGGTTVIANISSDLALPKVWRIQCVPSGVVNITYSVGYTLIP